MKRLLSVLLVVAMMVSAMSVCFSAGAADILNNESPTFVSLSTSDMSLQSQVYNAPADAKGVTVWLRVTGAADPFYLYEMKFNIATEVHSGIWSYNHGQDGCRNAMWQINGNGDYLFFIPFEYYTLSHSFIAGDTVKTISNFSIQATEISGGNRSAKIAMMGMFDGKVESFNTTFVDGEEKVVAGEYTYMNAERSIKATNYESTEYYDPVLGKAEHAAEPIDYTEKICTSWQYAYVDAAMPNDSAAEGEKFEGWMDAAENGSAMIAKGENTLYATYSDTTEPTYTVTFEDGDGNVIGTDVVVSGESAVYRGETPSKPATETTYFAFKGWDKSVMSVTEDMTVIAQYEEKDITYTVKYMNGNELMVSQIIKKNEASVYDSEVYGVPLKNGNAQEYYTFNGTWEVDGEVVDLSKIVSDMTVQAGYDATPETQTYTLTFKDWDGTVLSQQTTGVHSYIEYAGEQPTRPTDGEKYYTFSTWDKAYIELREDADVNAIYYETPVETGHKTGKDLGIQWVPSSDEVSLLGSLPYTYTDLSGNEFATIIFKAEGIESPIKLGGFRARTRGVDKDGKVSTQQLDSNISTNYNKAAFEVAEDGYYYMSIGYFVVNWTGVGYGTIGSISFSNKTSVGAPTVNTNENANIDFMYLYEGKPEFTVRYYTEDGELIDVFKSVNYAHNYSVIVDKLATAEEIFEGDIPAKAEDDTYKYEFAGWADANGNKIEAVYDNMDVYAYYTPVIKDPVTVTFKNGDETISSVDIPRGHTASFTGDEPRKASDTEWSYVFRGWNTDPAKALATTPEEVETIKIDEVAVNEDAVTYYAVFERVERLVEVTFYAEDKTTELGKVFVRRGELMSEVPVAPEKAADVQYSYAFDKYVDAEGNAVDYAALEADTNVYASYTATLNKYTVTFVDEDGKTELGTSTVDYGTAAEAPAATKEADDWYTYEFDKWVDAEGNEVSIAEIKGDMTVIASYTSTFVHNFTDLDPTRFYGAAVEYALVNGIMNGTSDTTFDPNGTTTRAQLVTVLYRIEGSPDVSEETIPFTDVPGGKFYTNAVMWAYANEIVNGTSATTFAPESPITREQFAAILYRYADNIKDYYVHYGKATLMNFEDKNDISGYAQTPIKWAIATEEDMYTQGSTGYAKEAYITGSKEADGKTYMLPKNPATRAQMATMLYRFLISEKITKDEA